mmetsp:Transcript_3766/g.9160  ORF Transcript_3766/g.9160 Transcript_3766/m.9160 type:complete len:104 (+) Transcript_3766:1044-1355(+)
MVITVRFDLARSSSASRATCTSRCDRLSNAAVASSSIRICGLRRSARAMDSRCRWPPDSREARVPSSVCQPIWFCDGRCATSAWISSVLVCPCGPPATESGDG